MKKMKKNLLSAIAFMCAAIMMLGIFAGCGIIPCTHEYENGVCTKCNKVCTHEEYENGVCEECGIVCTHEEYKNGVCKECGTVCTHEEYEDGVCKECGTVCTHVHYEDGECAECGAVCPHEEYENGVCKECGTVCAHKEFEDSICKECGWVCTHNVYNKGICAICQITCTHEYYFSGVCLECGSVCKHEEYESGKCKECGMKENTDYDYAPHLSKSLPRIDVTSASFMEDATREIDSFDNYNPNNNIDWQYHDCTVTVSGCEEKYELSEIVAGIKVRGNWTTTYPKKPFRIKFDKKQAMLGLNGGTKFKSWVLLADYKDFSLERNSVAFYLGQQIMGSDGYYCSDYRQVELYLNGEYWGVYLLAEQQQTGEGRIGITEPDDIEKNYQGTDIGYFIEFDGYYQLESYAERFSCNYNYQDQNSSGSSPLRTRDGNWVWPNQFGFSIKNDVYYDDVNNCAQKQFIKNYIWNLYKLCYEAVYNNEYYTFNSEHTGLVPYTPVTGNPVKETVSKVIDIQSLVDMYILQEIVCDYDIEWSSFLMDVDFGPDAKDNLLRFEAPWDFDSAFGLRYACDNATGLYAANKNNPWLLIFINEDWFWNQVKEKWQDMTANNVQANTLEYVRVLERLYSSKYYTQGNFKKWGFVINGESTWWIRENVWDHADAADHLYNWLQTRFNYLETQWGS